MHDSGPGKKEILSFLGQSAANVRAALPEDTPHHIVTQWVAIWRDYFDLHVDILNSRHRVDPSSPTATATHARLDALVSSLHKNIKDRLDHDAVRMSLQWLNNIGLLQMHACFHTPCLEPLLIARPFATPRHQPPPPRSLCTCQFHSPYMHCLCAKKDHLSSIYKKYGQLFCFCSEGVEFLNHTVKRRVTTGTNQRGNVADAVLKRHVWIQNGERSGGVVRTKHAKMCSVCKKSEGHDKRTCPQNGTVLSHPDNHGWMSGSSAQKRRRVTAAVAEQ